MHACQEKHLGDDLTIRFGSGLISDLASCIPKEVSKEVKILIQALSAVLKDMEITPEAKFHAIIAMGDVCLASEEDFISYLPEVMGSF